MKKKAAANFEKCSEKPNFMRTAKQHRSKQKSESEAESECVCVCGMAGIDYFSHPEILFRPVRYHQKVCACKQMRYIFALARLVVLSVAAGHAFISNSRAATVIHSFEMVIEAYSQHKSPMKFYKHNT